MTNATKDTGNTNFNFPRLSITGNIPCSAVCILFCCLFVHACARKPVDRTGKLGIVASITPLGDFARQVVGSHGEVTVLLPSNANPHTFELTPGQIEITSRARLLIINGAGLEFWLEKLRGTMTGEAPQICTATAGVRLLRAGHGSEANPHTWLDPLTAIVAVENIRDALLRMDSLHAAEYRANASRYIDSLRALDAEIQRNKQRWRQRAFISYHSSWEYFAERYGLEQAASIESSPGREITPREYGEIITLMKKRNIRVILGETSSPLKPVETLGRETGATIVVLDPIGTTSSSYLQMMRANLHALSRVLE